MKVSRNSNSTTLAIGIFFTIHLKAVYKYFPSFCCRLYVILKLTKLRKIKQ